MRTFQASHIELPLRDFNVKWQSAPCNFGDVPMKQTIWHYTGVVKAQTPGGALEILRFHIGDMGCNFRLELKR